MPPRLAGLTYSSTPTTDDYDINSRPISIDEQEQNHVAESTPFTSQPETETKLATASYQEYSASYNEPEHPPRSHLA